MHDSERNKCVDARPGTQQLGFDAAGCQHGHLTTNQIGHQRRQSIILRQKRQSTSPRTLAQPSRSADAFPFRLRRSSWTVIPHFR
jgi:hypothetical protein